MNTATRCFICQKPYTPATAGGWAWVNWDNDRPVTYCPDCIPAQLDFVLPRTKIITAALHDL